MLRVVLDTNVFISGILSQKGPPGLILKAWQEQIFDLIVSKEILREIEQVFFYEKIKKRHGWNDKEIRAFVSSIPLFAIMTPGKEKAKVRLKDHADEKFLIASQEGKADFLVTGDKELLRLKNYQGTEILSPNDFVKNILRGKI